MLDVQRVELLVGIISIDKWWNSNWKVSNMILGIKAGIRTYDLFDVNFFFLEVSVEWKILSVFLFFFIIIHIFIDFFVYIIFLFLLLYINLFLFYSVPSLSSYLSIYLSISFYFSLYYNDR